MRDILKIYTRDMKSIFTNWAAITITLALIILPSLYAWFNIKASWDPYGNTNGIKVAIVNEDLGGEFNQTTYNIGEQIIDKLKENELIGWQFTSKEDAEEGVLEGEYYACIVIPEDFTEDILSLTTNNIVYPKLHYTVNQKSNAIAPKITDKGVTAIKDEVSSNVVKTVNNVIFHVFDEIGMEVTESKSKIRKLLDTLYELNDNMPQIEVLLDKLDKGIITLDDIVNKMNSMIPNVSETLSSSKELLNAGINYLNKAKEVVGQYGPIIQNDLQLVSSNITAINNKLQNTNIDLAGRPTEVLELAKAKLQAANADLENTLKMLEAVNNIAPNENLQAKIAEIKLIKDTIENDILPVLNTVDLANAQEIINSSKDVLNRVDIGMQSIVNEYGVTILPAVNSAGESLGNIFTNSLGILNEAEGIIPDVQTVLNLTIEGVDLGEDKLNIVIDKFPEVRDSIYRVVDKLKSVDDEERLDQLLDLLINNSEESSSFLANPIEIEEVDLFEYKNYGSAMSPFYTSLALWVGGTLLISLFSTKAHPLEDEKEISPTKEYIGKGLTFLTIAVMQGILATVGDLYILGTSVLHPGLFILYGAIISVVFVTIAYTLVSVFGNVGKALAIIFLVLQVAASGGTFPVEVMPKFFQIIHPFLPFKYAIGALREVTAGIIEALIIKNTVYLGIYFIISIILGITLKKFVSKYVEGMSKKFKESGLGGH